MSGIYNVRLFSRLQGQGMLNRFFYLVGGDGDAELLCHGLLTTMLESMREGSSSELEFIGLSAKSVFPALPDEYVMNISPVKGYRGAASMPAFVNTTVTLASAYISGRRGRKAMSGTPEGAVTAGELTADMRASLELLGSGLLKQYDVTHGGVTALIMPMMAHKKELGTTYATLVDFAVGAVSTQNSRKTWSGGGAIPPSFSNEYVLYDEALDEYQNILGVQHTTGFTEVSRGAYVLDSVAEITAEAL